MKPTQSELSFKISSCKGCQKKKLKTWFSLGKQPPANSLLNNPKQKEFLFPLDVCICKTCGLVQLRDIVEAKLLFGNYVYYSSTASSFIEHFRKFAKTVFEKQKLKKDDLIVDIGSNDGILLSPFKELGAQVIGVEPAKEIAKAAQSKGVSTINSFFNKKLAKQIVKKTGKNAKVVTATNVFAHIYDLDEVVEGVKELIGNEGIFIIENPYLWEMVKQGTFDLVYHEHLFYYDLTGLSSILNRLNMKIVDFEKVPVHGGSYRYYISNNPNHRIKKKVLDALKKESIWRKSKKMDKFAKNIKKSKIQFKNLLKKINRERKTVVGYGAPAKASTILNYFNVDQKYIKFIVDDSQHKQNKFLPGMHIPIVATSNLFEQNPDYVVILAWNFAKLITEKLRSLGYKGKIITPF